MRNLAWLFIILTLIVWLAIARYWTGTGFSQTTPLDIPSRLIPVPTETPIISPEITSFSISTQSANSATVSATPTKVPSLNY